MVLEKKKSFFKDYILDRMLLFVYCIGDRDECLFYGPLKQIQNISLA